MSSVHSGSPSLCSSPTEASADAGASVPFLPVLPADALTLLHYCTVQLAVQ